MEHLFLMFLDYTQRHTTVGRTPLDEWSARRRDLYLTTHDTHNRQISMPPVGFEPKISARHLSKRYAMGLLISKATHAKASNDDTFCDKYVNCLWAWRFSWRCTWCLVFRDVKPCILKDSRQRFGRACCIFLWHRKKHVYLISYCLLIRLHGATSHDFASLTL